MFKPPIKEYVVKLCKLYNALDIAAQLELREIDVTQALELLYKRTGNTDIRTLAQLSSKTKKQTSTYPVPTDPLKYVTPVEILEAKMRGISKETYKYNKGLPLDQRLRLPCYEAIYALNYKEKGSHKWKKGNSTTN